MKEKDIFDRLAKVVDVESDGVVADFARKIGVRDQSLRNIVKNRRSYPGYEILARINQSIKWLNIEWLLIGEGEMRKKEPTQNIMMDDPVDNNDRIKYFEKELIVLSLEDFNNLTITIRSQQELIKDIYGNIAGGV